MSGWAIRDSEGHYLLAWDEGPIWGTSDGPEFACYFPTRRSAESYLRSRFTGWVAMQASAYVEENPT